MSKPNSIRLATVPDAPSLRALRLEALRQHPDAFGMDEATELAAPLSTWTERLARSGGADSAIFVAAADDDLAGMAGIYRSSGAKNAHNASIWGMYVRPACRQQGLATRLLAACEGWAREQGVLILKLAAVSTNSAAILCYAHAGFVVYGVEPRALQIEGRFYDELMMAKVL